MNSIKMALFPRINPAEINVKNIYNEPFLGLLNAFWSGTEQELADYFQRHGIEPLIKFNSLYEVESYTVEMANKFTAFFKKEGTEKYSYKLSNIIKEKNLKNGFSDKAFDKIIFDVSGFDEDTKRAIKESFLEVPTRSFITFKNVSEDNDILELIYHKRGIYQALDERLGISQARERLTLLQNFKNPTDNNYISASFVFLFTKSLEEKNIHISFSYDYEIGSGQIVSKEITSTEILNATIPTKEEYEENKKMETIRKQAEEDLKIEVNGRRESLTPESLKSEAIKSSSALSASTQRRFDVEEANDDSDLNTQLNNIIESYKLREVEKQKIRLEQAQKLATDIYKDLQSAIKDGVSILEAMNFANQKYNNKDATNIASLFLTKDLLNISLKDKEIVSLKNDNSVLVGEKEKLVSSVAEREEAIRKLQEEKSAFEKEKKDLEIAFKNKFEELKNKFSDMMKQINENAEARIAQVKNEYESKIDSQTARINVLEAELRVKNKMIQDMNNTQNDSINSAIKNLEEKINSLAGKAETNSAIKENISTRLEELDKRIADNGNNNDRAQEQEDDNTRTLF